MTPREVFLSHSSQDQHAAVKIADTLRNHGVPVWLAPTVILAAQQWHDEIGRALRRCDWFMVLLSDHAVNSIWVRRELMYALSHKQYDNHIMPILLDQCDYEALSWTLGLFQMADYASSKVDAYTEILRSWGIGFDQAKAA